jgi:hypothetical protein
MGEGEELDSRAAGQAVGQAGAQGLESAGVGRPGEEFVAVDQPEQRHRLAAERVDDVPVVDHMAVPAVGMRSPAGGGELVRAAEVDLEPAVVEAHAQAMADQARWHAVEHLAQGEAARGGHDDDRLLVVGGAPGRQGLQRRALDGDARRRAGVVAPDHLVDEAAIGGQVGEATGAAQQQRIGDRRLEVAVRALDRAVLVREPGVVAAGCHAVVGAQRVVAPGQVLGRVAPEVAEGGREAVAAVLARRAAERPERVLQALGQRHMALTAEHDMGVLETRAGQPEVVQPVLERLAGDGDAEVAHVGEVRQAEPAGLVQLAEEHLLLRAVQRPPAADPALEGAADAAAELGVAAQHLLENRDRPQARRGPQQRHDLALPDRGQRVRPAPSPQRGLLRWRPGVRLDPVRGGGAEPGPRGGDRDRFCPAERHVQPHLAVGDMAARQRRLPRGEGAHSAARRPRPPAARPLPRIARPPLSPRRSGDALPTARQSGGSHPDRR